MSAIRHRLERAARATGAGGDAWAGGWGDGSAFGTTCHRDRASGGGGDIGMDRAPEASASQGTGAIGMCPRGLALVCESTERQGWRHWTDRERRAIGACKGLCTRLRGLISCVSVNKHARPLCISPGRSAAVPILRTSLTFVISGRPIRLDGAQVVIEHLGRYAAMHRCIRIGYGVIRSVDSARPAHRQPLAWSHEPDGTPVPRQRSSTPLRGSRAISRIMMPSLRDRVWSLRLSDCPYPIKAHTRVDTTRSASSTAEFPICQEHGCHPAAAAKNKNHGVTLLGRS